MPIHSTPDRGAGLAGVAAVASVLAASNCCLPLFPFLMAASFAGSSALLTTARPYLLGASVLLIALGFYQARRTKQCRRRPSVASAVLLWVSTGFVALSIFFPQALANVAAGRRAHAPARELALRNLTEQNVATVGDAFNAAQDDARVLALFSPT